MSKSSMGGCKKKSMKGKGSYANYKAAGTRLKNKRRKLLKHCNNHPSDHQSDKAWDKLFK